MASRRQRKNPYGRRRLRDAGKPQAAAPRPWLQGRPAYVRVPLLTLLAVALLAVGLVALPVITFMAGRLEPSRSVTPKGERAPPLVMVAGTIAIGLMALASGSSLVALIHSGELCWRPSRYAGMQCLAPLVAPFKFAFVFVFLWTVFWLSAAAILTLFRRFLVSDTTQR